MMMCFGEGVWVDVAIFVIIALLLIVEELHYGRSRSPK